MDISITVAGDLVVQAPPVELAELSAKMDTALAVLTALEATVSDQSVAIDELKTRLGVDWQHAQDTIASLMGQLSDVSGQLVAALANDAADAATIAAKQAEIDQLLADAQTAVDAINAIDLDASFPPAPGPAPEG